MDTDWIARWQDDLANLLDSLVSPAPAEEDWSQYLDPPLMETSDWGEADE